MTLPASYFDTLYERSRDPWSFQSRWYEHRKYALTLACLPKPRFRNVFEPGCSIGVFTEQLAARCDALLAVDVSAAAVTTAGRRVEHLTQVTVRQADVASEWPDGEFDLILVCEMGYYFDRSALGRLVDRAAGSLAPDGHLVAVHWRHPVDDYPLTGDEVHQTLRERARLRSLVQHVEDDFLLDVLGGPATMSVAAAGGLL